MSSIKDKWFESEAKKPFNNLRVRWLVKQNRISGSLGDKWSFRKPSGGPPSSQSRFLSLPISKY